MWKRLQVKGDDYKYPEDYQAIRPDMENVGAYRASLWMFTEESVGFEYGYIG
jgi:hypothetical protein